MIHSLIIALSTLLSCRPSTFLLHTFKDEYPKGVDVRDTSDVLSGVLGGQ